MNERLIRVRSYLHWCKTALEMKPTKPEIILKGNWLASAGFGFGDKVRVVQLSDGKLLVERC